MQQGLILCVGLLSINHGVFWSENKMLFNATLQQVIHQLLEF